MSAETSAPVGIASRLALASTSPTSMPHALMVEEDLVLVAVRLHADVVLLRLLMGDEGLDEEVRELPRDAGDRRVLAHPLHDPGLRLVEALVHGQEPRLAPAPDDLVWLGHQLLLLQPGVLLQDILPTWPLGPVQDARRDQAAGGVDRELAPGELGQP
eukprot:CAMPEP_0175623100 /NCGR_PEP_ID=MMETSP0096-20121207/69262_1 /TAXON_ID=311494 /ORGANISM="Alexandrium monilatum, Strain CCMP3105" /LENGTH=157 /DNA_ID=CAMNT_0016928361 /DNA_START=69 /DNA_END=539 /DNA_ORIENTATION=+